MSAPDRPVVVRNMNQGAGVCQVKPSDVVVAHNAQTADQADRLVLWRDVPGLTSNLLRERDEARAEVEQWRDTAHRLSASVDQLSEDRERLRRDGEVGWKLQREAQTEIERLRGALRPFTRLDHDLGDEWRDVCVLAREALGETKV